MGSISREAISTMTNPNVHHRKQRNNSHNRPSSAERNKQRATRGRVNPAPRAAVRPSLLRLRKLFNFCKALSNFRAALLFREEEVQSGRCWLDEEIENQPAPTNAAADTGRGATLAAISISTESSRTRPTRHNTDKH